MRIRRDRYSTPSPQTSNIDYVEMLNLLIPLADLFEEGSWDAGHLAVVGLSLMSVVMLVIIAFAQNTATMQQQWLLVRDLADGIAYSSTASFE